MLSLIIPTYNEAQNIKKLLEEIKNILDGKRFEIIIVDDNSPDGTAEIAREFINLLAIRVIKRKKRGLATAVVRGFKEAKGDFIGVIDGDLSHPPAVLLDLLQKIKNYDIAIASRFAEGGNVEKWPINRKVLSKIAVFLTKPLTKVKDPLSGYFIVKKEVIENANLQPAGYKILLEILAKGNYKNFVEIPYVFRNRLFGKSKLNLKEYFLYLIHILKLYEYKIRNFKK